MRYSLLTSAALLTLVGCSTATPPPQQPQGSVTAADTAVSAAPAMPSKAPQQSPDTLAPDTAAMVTDNGECPYLDTQWLAQTNGQRVTRQGIDARFDTPACIFWSYPQEPQATVMVRRLDNVTQARAAVDWAAPIALTEPVSDNGWEGGRGVLGPEMAVYAVQKGPTAVLVWTNQVQTLKAELIAQEAIKNLGL